MIDTVALKTKVLSLAFRGELSEQTDENAEVLLERVFEEKDLLIKEKAIKKNKTKPITNDEILFTIPSNWLWVRLGEVINLQSGQDLTTSDYNDKELGVPYITGASNFRTDESLIINRWTVTPKAIAVEDDILLSVKGTVGKLAFLHEEKVHIARQIMGIRPIGLNRKYVKYFVQEQVEELKAISKGLIPGIERDNVLNMLMPMPPLGEQEQIVEKIEEAFAWLDTIDLLQHQYSSDLEVLKSKIIDAGIQGKLTEQLPEDGTAEELLEQISIKKVQMIKDGIIPKESSLPQIVEEEKKVDIPDNWSYSRVQDVASYITDYVANGSFATLKANTTTYKAPNHAVFVRTLDLSSEFKNDLSYIDESSYDFLKKSKLYGGELILPNIGASIGKAFIMPDLGMPMSLAPNSVMVQFENNIMNKFFYYVFQSSYGKGILMNIQGGAATPKFSKTDLRKMVIMLPPLAEQERIVNKIEEIFALI